MSHPNQISSGVRLRTDDGGRTLFLTLSGKLTTEDYEAFVPLVDLQIEEHGKVRMLVHLDDFHGWTVGAVWQDTKFAARHFADIERLAIVGDSRWEEGMAVFCRPFTRAKVRYFDVTERAAADAWIRSQDVG
jgi:hypothetical protein